jgi:hypothetical protein
MVEFLADKGTRPHPDEATWVCNAKRGPNNEGIATVKRVQERYGFSHVTTGNAKPVNSREVGVYVRADVLASAPNFLREHLSR